MNYKELISIAQNKAKFSSDSIKKTTTKSSSGPDPKAIEQFLVNKRLKEIKREEEERQKRERLLYLRSQNSKASKKAKLMANRTKDNDYSKIKVTEKDLQNKERIDAELKKRGINDKLDRMKQRIELEKEEEEVPTRQKRKRKEFHSQNSENGSYDYNEIKKNRDEIFKTLSATSQQEKQTKLKQPKPNFKPPSFEEILKLAEQQKEKKKTLEEEIEEELASKKNKIEKEEIRKKEELYQKSLIGNKKRKDSVEPVKQSKLSYNSNEKDDVYSHSANSSSSNPIKFNNLNSSHLKSSYSSSSQSNSKKFSELNNKEKPIPKLKPTSSKLDKYDFGEPISQTLRRQNNELPKKDNNNNFSDTYSRNCNNIENILNTKPGDLATKIANLSKEQLLALSKAVKKVKKEKKGVDSEYKPDEYSPKADHNEYKPNNFKTSTKSTNRREPVYVPTKINNKRESEEEYDPVYNYKSSAFDKKKLLQSTSRPSKLFDIDSLTAEEIEKIRKDRIEKQNQSQQKVASSSKPVGNDSKFKKPLSLSTGESTQSFKLPTRPSYRELPPISTTYRRGDYYEPSSSYYDNYDEEYDEEDDEMADFIEDSDDYGSQREEISKAISELFPKYNRQKYRSNYYEAEYDDYDVEESSYDALLREEERSERIAKYEDHMEELIKKKRKKEKAKKRAKGLIVSSDEDDDD